MGNHFDFEIKSTTKNSTINLSKWLLNIIIFILMITIGFVVFLKIEQRAEGTDEIIKQISLPNFAVLNRVYAQARVEQETQILLGQEYIDPLTDFINKYRSDSDKVKYVQIIAEERGHRCEQIKNLYINREKTTVTLMRLRKFYDYSCPKMVEDFAATINKVASK